MRKKKKKIWENSNDDCSLKDFDSASSAQNNHVVNSLIFLYDLKKGG